MPISTELTPLRFLQRSAEVHPDKLAIVDGPRRLSFAHFATLSSRMARSLQALGTAPGDRVALLTGNSAEMVVAHFGVPLAGAVLVPINTRLGRDEINGICDHSGATILITETNPFVNTLKCEAPPGVRTVVLTPSPDGADAPMLDVSGEALAWSEFLALGSDEFLPWEIDDERSLIAINYTSGTTGQPKGAMYDHRGAYLNTLGQVCHQGLTPDSVFLWTLPMFHCNGWCSVWASTAAHATQVCLRAVRDDLIWEALTTEGITHLCGSPTVLRIIGDAPQAARLDHPLTVTTAGAPPSPTIITRFLDLGVQVNHVYGLTETYGPYAICELQPSWDALDRHARSLLQARQGVGMLTAERLRVVRTIGWDTLVDVPADGETLGEIVMRGNTVMAGYYRDQAATDEAFRGGWFHSGDIGVMHPDGYVELHDRAKDIIISGGENISSVEVEHVILSHSAVRDVAVVGIPDDLWGEVPKAFIVRHDDLTLNARDIIDHVRDRIAHFKAPREVEFVDALPRTETGKVRKNVLREREWARCRSQIRG